MALPSPNLDDRTFDQLVEASRQLITRQCPEWSDLSPSDPGMMLVEVFAYLTETMIYRLNRVPEKAYIEFLRLLGVTLSPPAAATVSLQFTLSRPAEKSVEVPRGTRVTVSRSDGAGEPPVFVTADHASITGGAQSVNVLAYDCEVVEAEAAGTGTGDAGLSIRAKRPPIIRRTGNELDLIVGVEAAAEDLRERVAAREYGGKFYRIWREVENFAESDPDDYVYMVDRVTGTISFAPDVQFARVPRAGSEIRLWYRRGGGLRGNVASNTLTVLKDPIPGVSVNNPKAASGGASAESVEDAIRRGPREFHSGQRAVTARDFEYWAIKTGGVSRARTFTQADLWKYASPGTVEVVLVPSLDEGQRRGRISAEQLQEVQTDQTRQQVERTLDERRPLGTACVVNWVRYKTVKVEMRVVAYQQEDLGALQTRIKGRLYHLINPLPFGGYLGWRFGQALWISNVYDSVRAEPGVSHIEVAKLIVDEVPDRNIFCLAADLFQANTWYAGTQNALYRSTDNGDGWEAAARFQNQDVQGVCCHPERAGLVAVSTSKADGTESQVHVSRDGGESWERKAFAAYGIEDLAWVDRKGRPVLLLATTAGLYELEMLPDAAPIQVAVHPDDNSGYWAVAAIDFKGNTYVAAAGKGLSAVYLCSDFATNPPRFRNIGLAAEDVQVLEVQRDGDRAFLWAGLAVERLGDSGKGCHAWELSSVENPDQQWESFGNNWHGGSCVALAFQETRVLAATYDAGVLWLEKRSDQAVWVSPDPRCGLPLGDNPREHPFDRVDALAAVPEGTMVFAGGRSGVFRSSDGGRTYEPRSAKIFIDKVTLPPNWLFCSGEHEIEVATEGETGAD